MSRARGNPWLWEGRFWSHGNSDGLHSSPLSTRQNPPLSFRRRTPRQEERADPRAGLLLRHVSFLSPPRHTGVWEFFPQHCFYLVALCVLEGCTPFLSINPGRVRGCSLARGANGELLRRHAGPICPHAEAGLASRPGEVRAAPRARARPSLCPTELHPWPRLGPGSDGNSSQKL